MNLFQAAGMVLSPTDNVLPAQFSRTTSQSIPNGTNTQIVWNTTEFNPSNAIALNTSTGRLTNNGQAGYYKFSGLIRSPSYSGSSNTYTQIYRSLNGGTNLEISLIGGVTSGSGYTGIPFEFSVYLASSSYIDIIAFHNFGSTLSFNVTQLDVQRIDKTAVSAIGQPQIAYIKDVKSSGTAGGTFTSGSYITRTLNTIEDTYGIVSSLTSNQFILPAGKYDIHIIAPRYLVNVSKVKLRNITDSTNDIIGLASDNGSGMIDLAYGIITIGAPKTFEVQHRCGTTRSTDGLGTAASYGESEIFTVVRIQKL
jgi:hypothetical protein